MDSRDIKEIVLHINSKDAEEKIKELTLRLETAREAKEKLIAKGIVTDKDKVLLQAFSKEVESCTHQLSRI